MRHKEFLHWINGFLTAADTLDLKSVVAIEEKLEEVRREETQLNSFESEFSGILAACRVRNKSTDFTVDNEALRDIKLRVRNELKLTLKKKFHGGGGHFCPSSTPLRC